MRGCGNEASDAAGAPKAPGKPEAKLKDGCPNPGGAWAPALGARLSA